MVGIQYLMGQLGDAQQVAMIDEKLLDLKRHLQHYNDTITVPDNIPANSHQFPESEAAIEQIEQPKVHAKGLGVLNCLSMKSVICVVFK